MKTKSKSTTKKEKVIYQNMTLKYIDNLYYCFLSIKEKKKKRIIENCYQ